MPMKAMVYKTLSTVRSYVLSESVVGLLLKDAFKVVDDLFAYALPELRGFSYS